MFKWFVVHVKAGSERKAVEALRHEINKNQLENSFEEIIYPEEEVTSNVKGKKRTLKKKVFPGYILVKMLMSEQTWHLVKNTNHVVGFLGSSKTQPLPLSEEEAGQLIGQLTEGFKTVKRNQNFSLGDKVKVLEGPFANFMGVIEALGEKGKLKIQISIFGRTTPVELSEDQVEKV